MVGRGVTYNVVGATYDIIGRGATDDVVGKGGVTYDMVGRGYIRYGR